MTCTAAEKGDDILSPLDFVPFPLQPGKQIFQAGGHGDQPVDGGFQLCLVAGAVLCGLMLNVALALIPARDDDGQAVFFAQPVAGPAYLVIAALVGMVVLVVGEADSIENQVIMDVILVNVSGEDKFIFAAQDLPCQFHADPVGFLWHDLPRFKGLDQVTAQVCALVDGMAACPFKFNVGGLGGAAEERRGGRPQVVLRHVGRAAVKGAARMAGAASSGRPIPDGERVTRVNIGSNRSFQKMKWQSRGRTGLSLYL